MKTFIRRFGNNILGVLHGFDRIRFRGTRRLLANVAGMMNFLWLRQVLLKDFKAFAGNLTAQVRQAAADSAVRQNRPIVYLHNSAMDDSRSLAELAEAVCEPVKWQGKRARGLNPLAKEDARLLEAVNRGEFAINGFRNRDLRKLLFTKPAKDEAEQRQRSGAITRKIRLLRAHGLIHKVPKTHRYQLSPHGRDVINALLTARQASTAKLAA